MDVASSDDSTDNKARNMQKAEKEANKLEKEYKAEQKKPESKNTSVLDALRDRYSEYILTLKSDTAASFKNRKYYFA